MFKKYKILNFTGHINAFRAIERLQRMNILGSQNTVSVKIIIILFFLVKCPCGWKNNQNSCYLFVQLNKTWSKAAEYCSIDGGKLASINDQKENDFIFSKYLFIFLFIKILTTAG